VALRLQIATTRGFEDFGRLSTRRVVTGSTGRAVAVYTAPELATGFAPASDTGETVTIWVTPEGNDYGNAVSRALTIRLVPPGGVIPPFGATVGFTVTPAAPTVFNDVLFTTACPDAASVDCVRDPDGIVTFYRWEFGDGRTGSGPTESNTYGAAGTYLVTLTIGDGRGRTATVTRSVVVSGGVPPTAVLTASPMTVSEGETVFFNGSGSRAAPGRVLVSHDWDFGDGSRGSGVTSSHTYSNQGTYVVTLNVSDDRGQVGTATTSVVVEAPEVAALGSLPPGSPCGTGGLFRRECCLELRADHQGLPLKSG
jgi:chitodextrinase